MFIVCNAIRSSIQAPIIKFKYTISITTGLVPCGHRIFVMMMRFQWLKWQNDKYQLCTS